MLCELREVRVYSCVEVCVCVFKTLILQCLCKTFTSVRRACESEKDDKVSGFYVSIEVPGVARCTAAALVRPSSWNTTPDALGRAQHHPE